MLLCHLPEHLPIPGIEPVSLTSTYIGECVLYLGSPSCLIPYTNPRQCWRVGRLFSIPLLTPYNVNQKIMQEVAIKKSVYLEF